MSDAAAGVVWLGVNLLLARAAWLLCGVLFPTDTTFQRVGHVTVCCWAGIVGTALVLGSLGRLSAPSLLAVVAGLSALALLWARSRLPRSVPVTKPDGDRTVAGGGSEAKWLLAWLVFAAFCAGRLITSALMRLPTDWDSLTYHIPLVDQWLRVGSLYAPDCAFWSNPGNNELLGLWLAAPFSGDFLVALNNIPAVVVLPIAAVELAARVGLTRPLCHLTGFAAFASYPMVKQMLDAENDLAVAALFLASLGYGLRHVQQGRWGDLVFASVSLGLLAGIKFYAVGYAVIAGATWVLWATAGRGPRAVARLAGAGLVGGLCWGSYWYLRNAFYTGTPFYPQGLTPATDLLAEIRPGFWTSSLLGNGRPEVWPLALEAVWRMTGPVHLAAVLAFPLVAVWMVVSALWLFWRPDRHPEGAVRLGLAWALGASALLLATTPCTVEIVPGTLDVLRSHYTLVRYGLCYLSVAVVSFLVLLQDLWHKMGPAAAFLGHVRPAPTEEAVGIRPPLRGLSAILAILLLFSFACRVQESVSDGLRGAMVVTDLFYSVLWAVDFLALGAAVAWLWRRQGRFRGALVLCLTAAGLAGVAVGADWLAGRWHASFPAHYDRLLKVRYFTRLADMDPATTRVCVCDYRYYPFLGSRRQFRACRPEWLPTYASLVRYLGDHDATFIAVRQRDFFPQGCYEGVKDWLEAHPGLFEPDQQDGQYTLFRVNRARLADTRTQAAGAAAPDRQPRAHILPARPVGPAANASPGR
jgi:hypothetical protein